MEKLNAEKWVAMGLLTVVSVFFGLFPYLLFTYFRKVIRSDSKLSKIVLTALSSVSGGVLLAVTMLHILPEVREKAKSSKVEEMLWSPYSGSHIPTAEILMLYGFCLIYGLEEIAQFFLKSKLFQKRNRFPKHHHHHHHHDHPHSNTELGKEFKIGGKLDPNYLDCLDLDSNLSKFVGKNESNCPLEELMPCSKSQPELDEDGYEVSITITSTDSQASSVTPSRLHGSVSVLNLNSKDLNAGSALGAIRSLASLLALSFHAVMEGVAVGVENSNDLWITFGAIASHKSIIALFLGMEMMKSKLNWMLLVGSIFVFSIVSPVGILIGSVMSSGEFGRSGSVIVVEGLATGTLLYIIFFEILPPHDHHDHKSHDDETITSSESESNKISYEGLLRFVGAFLGVLLASYLLSFSSHSHNSSSDKENVGHNHDEHDLDDEWESFHSHEHEHV